MVAKEQHVNGIAWKLLAWGADALCALLCYYAVQVNRELKSMSSDIQELREWRAETAGNRYTVKDHNTYAEQQAREFQLLRANMSDMQQQWLKDIGEIRVAIMRIETSMATENRRP